MQTNLTESGPFERLLTVTIGEEELEDAKEKAARRLSRELKVKGFRPGKAPRRIVEQMVGSERLRSEALDDALPEIVGSALEQAEINPAVVPSVTGTRDTDTGVEVDVTVTMWPKADTVPDYRERRVVLDSLEVTEDEIDQRIEEVRDQFAELERVERPASPGDFVMVDLNASENGSRIEEASATDLLYEVGSGSFIAGLDEALEGSSAGTVEKVSTELPPGFGDYSGRQVEMQVLVKEVRAKQLPELTDEWVEETTEFESIAAMRVELGEMVQSVKQREAGTELRRRLLDSLLEDLELTMPPALVDAEARAIAHDFVHRLEQQGIEVADYMSITGQTDAELFDGMSAQADRNLRTRVLLEAIAEAEELEVEAADVDEVINALAQAAGQPVEEYRARLVESGQIQSLVGDMLRQKTIARLVELAKPVDGEGNPISLESPVGIEEDQAEDEEQGVETTDAEGDA